VISIPREEQQPCTLPSGGVLTGGKDSNLSLAKAILRKLTGVHCSGTPIRAFQMPGRCSCHSAEMVSQANVVEAIFASACSGVGCSTEPTAPASKPEVKPRLVISLIYPHSEFPVVYARHSIRAAQRGTEARTIALFPKSGGTITMSSLV
jgi:hypothetical protein